MDIDLSKLNKVLYGIFWDSIKYDNFADNGIKDTMYVRQVRLNLWAFLVDMIYFLPS